MDPVSHLLFGRALAALAPRPAPARGGGRGLTAAIVVGSIVPDVDGVLMPFGWDRYLLWHQRGTHALIGTMVDALLLAVVLRLLLRAPPAARLGQLALAAWLGGLGHILLDLVSGGTIRLLAPFTLVPFGVPWTAMADPLLALPLLLFFLATLVWRRQSRRLAVATLVTLTAIIGAKEVSRQRAVHAYTRATAARSGAAGAKADAGNADEASARGASADKGNADGAGVASGDPDDGAAPESLALEAAWGSFTRWWAFDRHASHLRTWDIDAWSGTVRLRATRDTRIADSSPGVAALVEASTHLETVRHLHSLFDLTFAEVRTHPDGTDVLWADIRFCDVSASASGSTSTSASASTPVAASASAATTACALWFGGTFESSGAIREQVVIVGTLHQTRPP